MSNHYSMSSFCRIPVNAPRRTRSWTTSWTGYEPVLRQSRAADELLILVSREEGEGWYHLQRIEAWVTTRRM